MTRRPDAQALAPAGHPNPALDRQPLALSGGGFSRFKRPNLGPRLEREPLPPGVRTKRAPFTPERGNRPARQKTGRGGSVSNVLTVKHDRRELGGGASTPSAARCPYHVEPLGGRCSPSFFRCLGCPVCPRFSPSGRAFFVFSKTGENLSGRPLSVPSQKKTQRRGVLPSSFRQFESLGPLAQHVSE